MAELLIILSVLGLHPSASLIILFGVVLTTCCNILTLIRLLFGVPRLLIVSTYVDISYKEFVIALSLSVWAVYMGVVWIL